MVKEKLTKILRSSEKFTKTDMVYLAKGGFWLTAGQIISAAATFGLAVAFANLLPKETYGTYKFVLSIAGMLTIFTLPGMMTSLTQAVARGFEGSLQPVIKERVRWALIGAAAALGVAVYYYVNGNTTLTLAALILAFFLPMMDTFGTYEGLLHGKKEFKSSSTYGLIQKLVSVVVMVGTMFVASNLFAILLAYFIPYTALRYFFLRRSVRLYQKTTAVDTESLTYGKHLSAMSVISAVANQLDKVLLFHFLGAAPLAIYSIAVAPPEQIKGVLKNINTLALPKFSQRSLPEIRSSIMSKIWRFGALLLVTSVAYILAAPYIFRIFFPEYMESIPYSQVFSLSIVAVLLFIPISVLHAHKKTKELYQFNLTTALFQIIIYTLLVPLYGLWGAIIAWMIGRTFNLLYSFYLIHKATQ